MFARGFTGLMLLVGYPISLLQVYHLLWIGFPAASQVCRFIRFRSPLLTESRLLSFPEDTEMFHFSSFASHPYTFRVRYLSVKQGGEAGQVADIMTGRMDKVFPA